MCDYQLHGSTKTPTVVYKPIYTRQHSIFCFFVIVATCEQCYKECSARIPKIIFCFRWGFVSCDQRCVCFELKIWPNPQAKRLLSAKMKKQQKITTHNNGLLQYEPIVFCNISNFVKKDSPDFVVESQFELALIVFCVPWWVAGLLTIAQGSVVYVNVSKSLDQVKHFDSDVHPSKSKKMIMNF